MNLKNKVAAEGFEPPTKGLEKSEKKETGRFTPATGVDGASRACYKDINCCFSGVQRAIMSWNPEVPW